MLPLDAVNLLTCDSLIRRNFRVLLEYDLAGQDSSRHCSWMQALVVVGVGNVMQTGVAGRWILHGVLLYFERFEKIKTDALQMVLVSCDADAHSNI